MRNRLLINQNKLDYSLPDKILALVKGEIFNYSEYLSLSMKDIDYDYYQLYPTINYGDVTVYSSSPSRRTESLALDIAAEAGMIREAKSKVQALQNGISRAASTCRDIRKRKGIRKDLEDNLLKGYLNQGIKGRIHREPKTLRTYKARSYYFMAVELGYITIDKDIRLAEQQLNRVAGDE